MAFLTKTKRKPLSFSSSTSYSDTEDNLQSHVQYLKTSRVWKRAFPIVPNSFPDKLLNALALRQSPNEGLISVDEGAFSFPECVENLFPHIPQVVRFEDSPIIKSVLEALEKNDPNIVYSLLSDLSDKEKKEVLNTHNWNGESVLTTWAQHVQISNPAHKALFEFLISHGADLLRGNACDGRFGNTPIEILIKRGYFEAVEFIFSSESYKKLTVSEKTEILQDSFKMTLICWNKSYEVTFTKEGVKSNAPPILMLCCLNDQLSHVSEAKKLSILKKSLVLAIKMGWGIECFQLFLNWGVDVNARIDPSGNSFLHFVAKQDNLAGVEFFVSNMQWIDCLNSERETALHVAAKNGNKEIAMHLLNSGAQSGASDSYGSTPLENAIKEGHLGVVEVILNYDSEELNDFSLLSLAIVNHHLPIAEFLIRKNIHLGLTFFMPHTPLYCAIINKNQTIVERLMQAGQEVAKNALDLESPSGRTAIELAAEYESPEILEYLWEQGGSFSPEVLWDFALGGSSSKIVTFLLKHAYNLATSDDDDSQEELDWIPNPVRLLAFCIKYGVDLNTQMIETDNTLLHHAIEGRDAKMIKTLLENGASLYIKNKSGKTPLHLLVEAFFSGEIGDMHINTQGPFGLTLLHYAVEGSDAQMVETLLANGADPSIEDERGVTPLALALNLKNPDIVEKMLRRQQ